MTNRFEATPSPVTESLILICEKCGKKLATSSDRDENPAVILQKKIKERIREDFGKGKFRCVLSTCMDVCPNGKLTLAISPADTKGTDRFFTFEETESDTLADEVLDLAKQLSDGTEPTD